MSKESQETPIIRGIADQLDRLERKLDALIDALAEEDEVEPQEVEIATMGGQRFTVPRGDGFL